VSVELHDNSCVPEYIYIYIYDFVAFLLRSSVVFFFKHERGSARGVSLSPLSAAAAAAAAASSSSWHPSKHMHL